MLLQKIPGLERFQYLNLGVTLYQAAFNGNWQVAKDLHSVYPDIVRAPITEGRETALHIAAAANHPNFVNELLKLMNREDLELKNQHGQTALHFAVASGNVIIAKEMVEKNGNLTLIRYEGMNNALCMAALLGRREMMSFLFRNTPFDALSRDERIELLLATISNDLYGMSHFSMMLSLS